MFISELFHKERLRPFNAVNVNRQAGNDSIHPASPLHMKTKLFIPLCVALPIAAAAQINYSGGIYTQDFNTLGSGVIFSNYTTMPAGWYVSKGSYVWTTCPFAQCLSFRFPSAVPGNF